jgi:hypothetical protein
MLIRRRLMFNKKLVTLCLKAFIIYGSNFWFWVMSIMGLVGLEKIFNGTSGWITIFVPIFYTIGVIVIIFVITDWKWKQLVIIFKQVKELRKKAQV